MFIKRFLLKYSSIYDIGNILSKAIAIILLPLYTKYLTPLDYGMMELISVTTGMSGVVVEIGISEIMRRFYYDFKEEAKRNRAVSTAYLTIFSTGLKRCVEF